MYNEKVLNQEIDGNLAQRLGAAIGAVLNTDIPAAQVIRAVKRYEMSFFPVARSLEVTFTAASELSANLPINIDASYGLFITQIIGRQSTEDTDGYLQSIQLNNGYNFLPERLPFVYTTRFVGWPLDWQMFVPPNSQIQTVLRNGSTTASANFGLTYKGYKLPSEFIKQLTGTKSF
jgi:hypothetical protein